MGKWGNLGRIALFGLISTRGPGHESPAQEMQVEVVDRLSAVVTVVNDQSVAFANI
jgi:hypothetical protein